MKAMRARDLDLNHLYKFINDQHKADSEYERIITVPTSALGTLREELLATLGQERTKGFLLRYGWHCGVSDALKMKEMEWENENELVWAGPKMHSLHGNLESIPSFTKVDFLNGKLHLEGIWKDSYEAKESIKLFGFSAHPACHTLVGYASGYLSTIIGKKVISQEVQCQAMGDEHCYCICKTMDEWGEEFPDKELKYYEPNSIIDELDQTYEELREERDNLNKTFHVHNRLMKEILRESDLPSIANTLHHITTLPVVIEDANFNLLTAAGISKEDILHHSDCFKKFIDSAHFKKRWNLKNLDKTLLVEVFENQKRLITPIFLHQKIAGYCSFLYQKSEIKEVNRMILERAALACSIYLLNERARFNTEQRMRGSFLKDLLNERLTTEEITNRAHYIGFRLSQSYFTIVINRYITNLSLKGELEFNDQLITELLAFFKERKENVLIDQQSGNVIVLLSESISSEFDANKETFCKQLEDYCSTRYPRHLFRFGISSNLDSIEEASVLYEESLASLKVTNRHQNLVFYDSLGIMGILFKSKNIKEIQKFTTKILGNLMTEDKNRELTKTLYHYLNNGCNVHKTARVMNFSIGGLRYRLQRINEILQTDINSSCVNYQMFLALQSLIALGELDVDRERKERIEY